MKTIKTASRNRVNFTYTDAMGVKHSLHPGDVDKATGQVVTAEWIAMLHRMDDNEVYNNNKHAKLPIQDWERPSIDAWKKVHPYEDLPGRSNLSVDAIGEDGDGNEDDMENGSLIAKASIMAAAVQEDTMLDRLREAVKMLDSDRQELYRRIVVEEENPSAVAKEYGVTKSAISHRMEGIKKCIRKNFEKISV